MLLIAARSRSFVHGVGSDALAGNTARLCIMVCPM